MKKDALVQQLLRKLLKSSLNVIMLNHQLKIKNIFKKAQYLFYFKIPSFPSFQFQV